jgi:drug/metabolite transporter (DMT)-like permease
MILVQRLGPQSAALGVATVPPLGVAIASLVLGEKTHAGQWVGALIVVCGLALASGVNLGSIRRAIAGRMALHRAR